MAKARPTMNATFWFSNTMPSRMAMTPRAMVDRREMRICWCSVARPRAMTLAYRSCEMAAAPASAKPATTATMVANVTAARKPSSRLPPTALARWTATILVPPIRLFIMSNPPAGPVEKYSGWRTSSATAPKPMMNVSR
ncbi:hypothetical protein G6F24_016990 [Rhizopus arrhizus]|nr:hypothetical protein G6F24_016990 [Rhizopus arrhizus]